MTVFNVHLNMFKIANYKNLRLKIRTCKTFKEKVYYSILFPMVFSLRTFDFLYVVALFSLSMNIRYDVLNDKVVLPRVFLMCVLILLRYRYHPMILSNKGKNASLFIPFWQSYLIFCSIAANEWVKMLPIHIPDWILITITIFAFLMSVLYASSRIIFKSLLRFSDQNNVRKVFAFLSLRRV